MSAVSDKGLRAVAKILATAQGHEFIIAEIMVFNIIKDRKLARITEALQKAAGE